MCAWPTGPRERNLPVEQQDEHVCIVSKHEMSFAQYAGGALGALVVGSADGPSDGESDGWSARVVKALRLCSTAAASVAARGHSTARYLGRWL